MNARYFKMRCAAHGANSWPAAYFCCLFITFYPASAALAQYHIDSWTTDNGLPQNDIRDVCQTPDGYLWLASMDGLVRFDGVRFTVFNRSNTPGILGNRFTSLYCQGGEFWAGTETSGVTRYRHGQFTTYTERQGLPSNDVAGVTGDDTGRIWALSGSSILQWSAAESRFNLLSSQKGKYSYFSNFHSRFGFWGINGNEVRLFVRGTVVEYPLPSGWPTSELTTIGWDLNGSIWLASADGKFAKLSDNGWSTILDKTILDHKRNGEFTAGDITTTYRDFRGNFWKIGVASDSAASFLQYLDVPWQGHSKRIAFTSFFEDREGSIWLPTDGQGLYRLRKQAISVFSKEDGLPDRNVYPIYQDRAGAIWIGTWNGGLARFDGRRFTRFSTRDGLTSNRINSIFEDRNRVLWIATPGGLERLRHERFELVQSQIPGRLNEIRVIYQDSEGTLWFGTSNGLIRCQHDRWSVLTTKDGLAGNDARVIIKGRAGNLWIGGYGGLTRLYHGQFTRWTEAEGLPSNTVRSLYEDREGVLWIGTYDGGLGRLQNGLLTRYTVREGLFNNGVFQILEDSRGYLWMTCNRGIYRVSKQELNEFAAGKRHAISSIVYGKSEGMRDAECNGGLWPAGIRARNGQFWFPTQDGVAVIDPERVEVNLRPPPVVIESILLDREPVEVSQALRITPGRENLEIEYTAPSMLNSEQIKFKYKLDGLDRDWVDAGSRRTAYYSHIPPGKYTFKVIAANSDGVWNTQGETLALRVLPPFYRTWWFITLILASAVAAVCFAWQKRVSELKGAQTTQQAFARQLIASQERERKRIAAELHDSLGQSLAIIKNRALLSLSTPGDHPRALEQLREISEASAEVIDEVKEIAHNLRPYQLDRLGLTRAIEAMIRKMAEARGLRFPLDLDRIDGLFSSEAEINIFRIVQESVTNIIKHAEATEARVSIRKTQRGIQIFIQDNGKGFVRETALANGGRQGFGLIGTAERVRLLGGTYDLKSLPGQGTAITVTIPLNDARRVEVT